MVNKLMMASQKEYELIFDERRTYYAEFMFSPMPVTDGSMYLSLYTTSGSIIPLPMIIPYTGNHDDAQAICNMWNANIVTFLGDDNQYNTYNFWIDRISGPEMEHIVLHYSGREKVYELE